MITSRRLLLLETATKLLSHTLLLTSSTSLLLSLGWTNNMSLNNGSSMKRNFGIIEKLKRNNNNNISSTNNNNDEHSFDIYRLFMTDDGIFPNNKDYPLLLYKGACSGKSHSEAINTIIGGEWTSPWVWGIFEFHHYHTTAWELLLCTQGEADIQMGGPTGPTVEISKGDLILIPPGFAHKQIRDSGGFTLLGSYPTKDDHHLGPVDTVRGSPTSTQRENIASCRLPPKDPFFGLNVDDVAFRNTIDQKLDF